MESCLVAQHLHTRPQPAKAAHSDTTYDWPDARLGRMGVGWDCSNLTKAQT
jgi:hypothetical protein